MPITILNPQPAPARLPTRKPHRDEADSDSDSDGGVAFDGDVDMTSSKRRRLSPEDESEILTPGTVITTDSQWMR